MLFIIPPVTDYFDALDRNLSTEKTNPSVLRPLLNGVDELYRLEVFSDNSCSSHVVSQLCLSAHQFLIASVRQVLSGHPVTVFPLARCALESACYAYVISLDERLEAVWSGRHDSESAKKQCRKEFGSAVQETSKNLLGPCGEDVSVGISALYEALIDFGAHPNPKSVTDYQAKGRSFPGLDSIMLGGVYAYDDPLTLRAGLASIETALLVAVIASHALGADHPLTKAASQRILALYEAKNALMDELQSNH